MITAGIDAGVQTIKTVILNNGRILSYSILMAEWDPLKSAEQSLNEAIEKAGISRDEVDRILATGIGRASLPFADVQSTEVTCDTKGVAWLLPSARTIIDIGAEESRVMKCDSNGKVLDFAKNDKCAAGVGTFVEAMARALEVKAEDMSDLALLSKNERTRLNGTCVVFAESEVVSLIHDNIPKADIALAVHAALVSKTVSLARRVGVENDVAIIGGVAKNACIIDCFKKSLDGVILTPETPQIVGALGAALLATDHRGEE